MWHSSTGPTESERARVANEQHDNLLIARSIYKLNR